MTQSSLKSFRDTLEAIVVALLLAFVIRAFIVQAFKIPSGSMLETLQIGDIKVNGSSQERGGRCGPGILSCQTLHQSRC